MDWTTLITGIPTLGLLAVIWHSTMRRIDLLESKVQAVAEDVAHVKGKIAVAINGRH